MLQRLSHVRFIAAMISSILILTLIAGSTMQVAGAATTCGGADTSIISCDDGSKTNGVFSILLMTINILTAGIGIAAVGGIVYGAILYATAGDSSEQISSAKTIIRNVIIGLVLFIGMYALLQYIIPGGILDRELNIPVAQDPPPDKSKGGSDSDKTNKTATIRIGSYNAWSVTKSGDTEQVRLMSIGIAKMREGGAEIVALQELSIPQTRYLRDNSYWAVYRSKMDGDRGLGVAYKRDAFKVIDSGDLVIPRDGIDPHEPIVTLERNKDKARITVMSVHLVAQKYGIANFKKYQELQQKAVKEKALNLKERGKTVILAGDFNWRFDLGKKYLGGGWMSPFKFQGDRVMNFMVPPDQKMSSFNAVNAGISDHQLIFIDAETTSFGD